MQEVREAEVSRIEKCRLFMVFEAGWKIYQRLGSPMTVTIA